MQDHKQKQNLRRGVRKHEMSDSDKERIAQETYGRRQLNKEENPDVSQNPISDEKKKEKDLRFHKTGHDAYLAKVVAERKSIKIETWSGKTIIGELLEFDKYALKIRKDGVATWYNKSSIESFGDCE